MKNTDKWFDIEDEITIFKKNQKKYKEYVKDIHKSVINLKMFDEEAPCPICGTILKELRGVKIGDYTALKRSQGEINIWVCNICCQRLTPPPKVKEEKKKKIGPQGWAMLKIFVDVDENVYFKGKIQEELKGTLPPTKWEIQEKPKKKNRVERQELRQAALTEIDRLKKYLNAGLNEKGRPFFKYQIHKITKQIKMQERIVKRNK